MREKRRGRVRRSLEKDGKTIETMMIMDKSRERGMRRTETKNEDGVLKMVLEKGERAEQGHAMDGDKEGKVEREQRKPASQPRRDNYAKPEKVRQGSRGGRGSRHWWVG